jgi:hypothetical protein
VFIRVIRVIRVIRGLCGLPVHSLRGCTESPTCGKETADYADWRGFSAAVAPAEICAIRVIRGFLISKFEFRYTLLELRLLALAEGHLGPDGRRLLSDRLRLLSEIWHLLSEMRLLLSDLAYLLSDLGLQGSDARYLGADGCQLSPDSSQRGPDLP